MAKTIEDIITLTSYLRRERDILSDRVARLNDELATIQNRLMPGIRSVVNTVAERHADLKNAIDESRFLFVKPRSIVANGLRIGVRKGRGGLVIEDVERTLALIKKHFPKQVDTLIKTKETPNRDAIEDLEAGELKKIGCEVEGTGDVVMIKPTDGAVDKLVKAMLKAATDEAVEEKEAA